MQFHYYMPTELFCGENCVVKEGARLKELGGHALIVTGKSSAKNGALGDVMRALGENGQQFTLFDRVTPNPAVACVREGISLLQSAGADFIVAVGGGSPMDAAKAIATLALQQRSDEDIFAGGYLPEALPMAHVPTTAGTGSEVTQYSIITNDALQTKTSIASPAMFPRFAFLDGRYTESLPRSVTVNTALDALSHVVESMLSRSATPVSDALDCESMRIIYPLLKKAHEETLTAENRTELLYASALAGMAIAQSGTTAVHGMGYALTYFYRIDHGRANALLLGETLRLCERKNLPQVKKILSACGAESVEEMCGTFSLLLGERENIPERTLREFAERAMGNKNIKKSAYEPSAEEVLAIYLRSFGYSS